MPTEAQIAANRANAQHSTGPKSDDGKARSAMNALKSGIDAQSPIIPGESPEALAQLRDEYYDRYSPADPEQRAYLDMAVRHDWYLRRFARVEEQSWAFAASRNEKPTPGLELAQAFYREDKTMMRLQRRMAYSEKAREHAMAAFHRLQAGKPATQPAETKRPLPNLASFPTTPSRGPRDPFLEAMKAHLREDFASHGADFDAVFDSVRGFGPPEPPSND